MSIVRFQRLPEYTEVNLPAYQSAGAAGIDLHSAQEVTIPPGLMRRVSTGFNVKIPGGYEGQVRSRSGMAFKCRTVVLNAPGTIDSDYTGELFVMLQNHSAQPVTINVNDRVAQLVVSPVVRARIVEVEEMPTTERGGGGFGSTGGMPGQIYERPDGTPTHEAEGNAPIPANYGDQVAKNEGREAPTDPDGWHRPSADSPSVPPLPIIPVNGVRRAFLVTPAEAERIIMDATQFNREVWEPFMERFRALTGDEQHAVVIHLEHTWRGKTIDENYHRAKVAEAMENPGGACSIGQKSS